MGASGDGYFVIPFKELVQNSSREWEIKKYNALNDPGKEKPKLKLLSWRHLPGAPTKIPTIQRKQ